MEHHPVSVAVQKMQEIEEVKIIERKNTVAVRRKLLTAQGKGISNPEQEPFITLIVQILATKQKNPDTDTSTLERRVDHMVYKLYDLTPERIVIVEWKE